MKKEIYWILISVILCFLVSFLSYKIFTFQNSKNEVDNLKYKLENIPLVDATLSLRPVLEGFVDYFYDGSDSDKFLSYSNKNELYKRLINGEIDVLISTGPTKEEKALADNLDIQLEYEYFLELPLVFFVNKNNGVDNLTTEEIKNIYLGNIDMWSDVGGNDEKIKLAHGFIGTDSYRAFTYHISDIDFTNKSVPVDLYKNQNNEIGYAYYNYFKKIYASDNVKILKINDIDISTYDSKKEEYPFITKYYIVTRKEKNEIVQKFKKALLSKECTKLLEDFGYVRAN